MDINQNQLIQSFAPEEDSKLGICMALKFCNTENGAILVSGFENGFLYFHDLKTTKQLMKLKIHSEPSNQ